MVQAIIYRVEAGQQLFLLLKRSAEDGDFWQSVTGSVEATEAVLDGLKREVAEETGLTALTSVTDEVYRFHWQKGDQTRQEQVYGVLVDESPIKLSHEHTEYRWCQLDEAMNLLQYEDNRQALRSLHQHLRG